MNVYSKHIWPLDATVFMPAHAAPETMLLFDDSHERRAAPRHLAERGEGRFKAIAYTTIFLLVIYSAVKIVPAYVSEYQLADKMQEQARFAVVNRYTEEQVRGNIFKVVEDLEIPAKREDIKVFASSATVKISLDYTVPVDLFFYHLELHFTPSSENKSLY